MVTLCRERKNFLKAASNQRYALAAAHVSYLQSLRDIGDALRKFSDQDIFIPTTSTSSSSPLSSPVLTLPSQEGKSKNINNHLSSSSPSFSHHDPHDEGSHVHISSGSEFSSPSPDHIHHNHMHHHRTPEPESEPEPEPEPEPSFYGYNYPYPQDWTQQPGPGVNTYAYYMKKSAPNGKSMIYQEPESHVAENGQWSNSPYGYGYPGMNGNNGGGFFGFPSEPSSSRAPARPPPPPSPPRVTTWDFLNFFDAADNGYSGYGYYGVGSNASSADSKEVREREGIPELEEETEQETVKEVVHKKKEKEKEKEEVAVGRDFGEGTSNTKAVPLQQVSSSEGSSKTVRFHSSDGGGSLSATEKESPDSVAPKGSPRKKGVSFEIDNDNDDDNDETPTVTAVEVDGESSILSSVTTLSPHGTRDLREVVREIRDEFETASNHGKEVALLLEACKPPYRSNFAAFRGINHGFSYSLLWLQCCA